MDNIINNIYDETEDFSVREPVGFSTLPPSGAEEPSGIEKPRSEITKPLQENDNSIRDIQSQQLIQEVVDRNILETDDSEDIDTSWIQESERYHHISDNQERELMDSIGFYFIYINKHDYIEKILFEKVILETDPENGLSFLSKETILKIIQNKKILTPTSKYKLIDILSFVVDIEPNKVKEFLEMDTFDSDLEKLFLKVLPIFNDIHIDKSIFVFHSINHLYFIFQEVQHSSNHRTTLKSILKHKHIKEGSDNNFIIDNNPLRSHPPIKEREPDKPTNKGTKKVRIVDNIRELRKLSNKGRFTRKVF